MGEREGSYAQLLPPDGTVKLTKDAAKWTTMSTQISDYHGYRFPPELISSAVWLYHRFCLSLRDVEELLADRGVTSVTKLCASGA